MAIGYDNADYGYGPGGGLQPTSASATDHIGDSGWNYTTHQPANWNPTSDQSSYLPVLNNLLNLGTGILSGVTTGGAISDASKLLGSGVQQANQAVQSALDKSVGYAQPYISAGTSALPTYQQAAMNQGMSDERIGQLYNAVSGQYEPYTNLGEAAIGEMPAAWGQLQNIGDVSSYMGPYKEMFSPYTTAGAEAAGQQMSAINDLRSLGSAMDYYNQVRPMYAPNIEAGQAMLSPAQQNALATMRGFNYGNFQNSGQYQALQTANTQAQRALEAQAAAQGMFGSGTMARALGERMQENYGNYFNQAQQADLQTKQAAASQFQALINQGLTAQQAANQVANQMMSNDVNKNAAAISALANVANQGLQANQSIGTFAQNERSQDINKAQAALNTLMSGANLGLTGQNAAVTNTLNLGNQQLAQQQQQANVLHNLANMGNVTAQQVMGNYLKGADVIGQNILGGAQLQGTASQLAARNIGNTAQDSADILNKLLTPDNINKVINAGGDVVNWINDLVNGTTVPGQTIGYDDPSLTDDERFYIDNGYWPS